MLFIIWQKTVILVPLLVLFLMVIYLILPIACGSCSLFWPPYCETLWFCFDGSVDTFLSEVFLCWFEQLSLNEAAQEYKASISSILAFGWSHYLGTSTSSLFPMLLSSALNYMLHWFVCVCFVNDSSWSPAQTICLHRHWFLTENRHSCCYCRYLCNPNKNYWSSIV